MNKIFYKNRQESRGNNKGLTFIELLVSVLVISFALVGIITTFAKSNIFLDELKQHAIVGQALREEMETLRAMDFDDILNLGENVDFVSTGFDQLVNPVGTLNIENTFSDDNIRKVAVSLTWDSPQGRALTKNLVTYISREGINKE